MSALVSLKAASKTFKVSRAFSDISLEINQGEVITLVGPNGSGKTTLLRSIVGMIAFDNNSKQKVLGQMSPIGIDKRRAIFYVPDEDNLIDDLTAREFLGFVADAYEVEDQAIERAIQALRVLDFDIAKLNHTIRTFSHGMRKKVQLASVFIPDVRLILIDEPTNGLDPTAVILLKKQLSKLISGKCTVLVSTHNLAFAEQIAKRVLLMKNELLYDGSLNKLLKSTGAKSLEEAYVQMVMQKGSRRHDG